LLAVLCKHDLDQAETLIIERLNDKDNRSETLSLFQRANSSGHIIPQFIEKLKVRMDEVLKREAVKSDFFSKGRSIYIDGPDVVWSYL